MPWWLVLMSTESLDAYLSKRPHTVESAPALARLHGVDPKTVTARLTSLGYVKQSPGTTWLYTPPLTSQEQFLASKVWEDCRVFTVNESTLNLILSRIPTSPPDRDPPPDEKLGAKAVRLLYNDFLRVEPSDRDEFASVLVAAALTYCHARGMLPLRAEITTSGFKPLTNQPNQPNQP